MLAFFVLALLQLVVSAKAGLVNAVYGHATVAVGEQLRAGKPIETGPRSHLEILLSPASFVRLDENSRAVLDSVDLDHIVVHLNAGTVLVAASDIDATIPIHVLSGDLHALILSKGIYRFTGNTAAVIDGKLSTAESTLTVRKGRTLTVIDGQYRNTASSKDADSPVKKFLREPKAGFVNAVEGAVNVGLHHQATVGEIMRTGPGGRVELLVGPNEYLRLDENSAVVFDSIALNRQVYRLPPATGGRGGGGRGGEDGPAAVIVNERLKPIYRISGAALLESGPRLSRFVDNIEYFPGRRPPANSLGKETWISRAGANPMTMEADALDHWSERRSYDLARATQMADYADTPRQNGWVYCPELDGLTFIPGSPSRSGYGYASTPLFPTRSPTRGTPPPRRGAR